MAGADRNRVLDGARGLAVLIVFLSHSSGRDMALAPWLQFQGIGHVGVYLFFVLSGFLLTRTLMDGGVSAGQFYLRRFFRIAPLYFLVLAGVLVEPGLESYSRMYLHISGGSEGALLHFLFLKGDGVFWTLAAEFTFYLLLPLIVVGIARFGWQWLAAAAVFYFGWTYAIQEFKVLLPPLRYVEIAHKSQYLDVFACGVLAAYVRRDLPKIPIAIGFWGLMIATVVCVSANVLGAGRPWYELRWISLGFGAVFGLALVTAMQGNRWIAAPLEMAWLRFMGIAGFGWYLLHLPVLQWVGAHGPASPVLRLVIASAVSAAIAWMAFVLVERPAIRFGRRLEARLPLARQPRAT